MGTFTKKEKAEEGYFPERIKEQLAALKKQHEEEITHHKKEIERLQKEIEQHKQNIKKLKDHDTAAVSGTTISNMQGAENSQVPQGKYAELLVIIEELGKEI
ncbi:ATPase inhibitor, mitochondrial [Myotis davidii]|uniref:ATPase inhibitor, mitochondrial n=1 Tax=Myotis davidii TaxID=225400 RepID=L5M7L9_MYODS|nr:ATPase inhibitor, mitochondrial [Myotis davidii]